MLSTSPYQILLILELTEAYAQAILRGAWLKQAGFPLAVFCGSDGIALQFSEICERNGISVPQEVAILGSGNDEVACFSAHPTLSSVDMRFEEIGAQAVDLLMDHTLAETLNISRRMFEHRFQRKMNIAPAAYLRAKRLRRAMELLENSDMQITEIAYAAGFANAAHFCTLFRKHQGMSPKQYRAGL